MLDINKKEFWMGVLVVMPAVFGIGLGAKYNETANAGLLVVVLFALAGAVIGFIAYALTKDKSITAKILAAVVMLAILVGVATYFN